MMQIVINPGTGAIDGATEENAIRNMRHFVTDTGIDASFVRVPELDYGEGRYGFLLWKGNQCHQIQMPGWSLHRVRYLEHDERNVWDFPRLYVDGSSWLWFIAVSIVFRDDD